MKKVLSVLVAAGVFAGLPGSAMAQPAGDPAELAEARAILAIMFPPAEREATFNKIGAALANPVAEPRRNDTIAEDAVRGRSTRVSHAR